MGWLTTVLQTALKRLEDTVDSILNSILKRTAVCEIQNYELPNAFYQLSSQKQQYDIPIRILCDGLQNLITQNDKHKLFAGYKPDGSTILTMNPLGHSTNSTYIDRETNPPAKFNLDSNAPFPTSPILVMSFWEQVTKLYEEKASQVSYPFPRINFRMNFNGNWLWSYSGQANIYSVPRLTDKSARERINDIFNTIDEDYQKGIQILADQTKVLNSLNHTEIKILKYLSELKINKKGSHTHITDIIESIGDLQTTKNSISEFLDALEDTTVDYDGKEISLVESCQTSNYYGEYMVYSTPIDWNTNAFTQAKPRPFSEEELHLVKPKFRATYFQILLESATDNDSRWNIISLLEHCMTKQYAIQFAKSERGKQFFCSFSGDDAIYAKFFIEGLPGCKKRAAELYPDL